MNTFWTGRIALGIAALMLVGAAACASDDDDDDDARSSEGSESTAADVALQAGSGADGGTGTTIGALEPGQYRSSLLSPPIHFEVGDGWTIPFENEDELLLHIGEDPKIAGLYILDVTNSGAEVTRQPVFHEGSFDESDTEPWPDDYGAWLARSPELEVTGPEPITFAGASGISYDVRIADVPDGDCSDGGPDRDCVYVGGVRDLPLAFVGSDHLEIHLLDIGGSTILVVVEDAERHKPEMDRLLDSVEWIADS